MPAYDGLAGPHTIRIEQRGLSRHEQPALAFRNRPCRLPLCERAPNRAEPGASRARESLRARHGVSVPDVFRQTILAPGRTLVLRAEDLSATRNAVNALGPRRIHGGGHHRRLRFDAMI